MRPYPSLKICLVSFGIIQLKLVGTLMTVVYATEFVTLQNELKPGLA